MGKSLLAGAAILALAPAALGADAFPGAAGPGKVAQGGRDGAILYVTTLQDAVPAPAGSLRACLEASGPRMCIFRVGGIIQPVKGIFITNPYLTIAGQTAPGGGILVTSSPAIPRPVPKTPLIIQGTNDIIVRNIRVRLQYPNNVPADALTIERSSRVYVDHFSASWATDEGINGHDDSDELTVAYSIFGEGLQYHSKCALFGSDADAPEQIAFWRNICISNNARNTDHKHHPGSCVNSVNNAVYNPGLIGIELWPHHGAGDINVRKSVFKAGPNTSSTAPAWALQTANGLPPTPLDLHAAGNVVRPGMVAGPMGSSTPTCPVSVPEVDTSSAWREVKTKAGAYPRDGVDTRFVDEMGDLLAVGTAGSLKLAPGALPAIAGGTPYADLDEDGMADSVEFQFGGVVGTYDPWADPDGDGWSNLDEFLDWLQAERMAKRYPS